MHYLMESLEHPTGSVLLELSQWQNVAVMGLLCCGSTEEGELDLEGWWGFIGRKEGCGCPRRGRRMSKGKFTGLTCQCEYEVFNFSSVHKELWPV